MNEADKLNRINDLELELSQLKEIMPQAFAALDYMANQIQNTHTLFSGRVDIDNPITPKDCFLAII